MRFSILRIPQDALGRFGKPRPARLSPLLPGAPWHRWPRWSAAPPPAAHGTPGARQEASDVRHRPGSPAETRESTRYSSAHPLTSRSGSGSNAVAKGSSTTVKIVSATSGGLIAVAIRCNRFEAVLKRAEGMRQRLQLSGEFRLQQHIGTLRWSPSARPVFLGPSGATIPAQTGSSPFVRKCHRRARLPGSAVVRQNRTTEKQIATGRLSPCVPARQEVKNSSWKAASQPPGNQQGDGPHGGHPRPGLAANTLAEALDARQLRTRAVACAKGMSCETRPRNNRCRGPQFPHVREFVATHGRLPRLPACVLITRDLRHSSSPATSPT
jgi:hypothetical protein